MIKKKKVPVRMCVGCKERKRKIDLIRIVRTPEGDIRLDSTGKMSGRGAYICPGSEECLKKSVKSNALERALETRIDSEIYDKIKNAISYDKQ